MPDGLVDKIDVSAIEQLKAELVKLDECLEDFPEDYQELTGWNEVWTPVLASYETSIVDESGNETIIKSKPPGNRRDLRLAFERLIEIISTRDALVNPEKRWADEYMPELYEQKAAVILNDIMPLLSYVR